MNLSAGLLLAAALSAGNAEFERTAVVGAAEITIARLKAETLSSPSVTGVLRRAMLAEPSRFAARDAARKAGEAIYAKAVEESFHCTAGETLARLAGARPPEEVFGTNFVLRSCALSEREIRRMLDGPYTNVFARERRAACEEQARGLVAAVRPPMADVDSDDDEAVRRKLLANIAAQKGLVVFEENGGYVSQKIVEPMLADARREKRRQEDYVRRVRSEAFAPSRLRADIVRKLEENVRARVAKTENAALKWEIFPSVTNVTLRSSVHRRTMERLATKVAERPFAVRTDEIARRIAADPIPHRRPTESRGVFRRIWVNELTDPSVRAVRDEAPEGERRELGDYLAAHASDETVTKALDKRIDGELMPKLAAIRRELSEREFATLWPTFADRTWFPDADLADEIAARTDFSSAVRNWRTLPSLAPFVRRGKLEESDALANRAVREAFELARAAVVGQTKTVDEVKPSVLAESIDRKNSFFSRTPDLKAIVRLLTEATLTRWTERKNAILWPDTARPANADAQHAELFPSVRRRIELVAKEILEEMEKPEPEDPPEPPPVETPPDEPKLEYAIIVSRRGDRVAVKLEKGGADVVSRETDAKLAPFRAAMKEVADKLGAEILKLK